MKPNVFFLFSVLLAIVAFGFQVAARGALDKGMHLRAKTIAAALAQQTKVEADPEALRYYAAERTLRYIGFACTSLGVACYIAALYRHERGWYLILTGLLFLGIFTPMLL